MLWLYYMALLHYERTCSPSRASRLLTPLRQYKEKKELLKNFATGYASCLRTYPKSTTAVVAAAMDVTTDTQPATVTPIGIKSRDSRGWFIS